MFMKDSVFDKRYYCWCLSEWEREIINGYPLLRLVKEDSTIQIMESLEDYQKMVLAKVLVKESVVSEYPEQVLEQIMKQLDEDKKAMVLKALMERGEYFDKTIGDHYTEEERNYVNYYLQESRRLRNIKAASTRLEDYNYHIKIDKKRFKKYIIEALTPVLGINIENEGGGVFSFCTPIGQWNVITSIDIGGRHHNLCYDHEIKSKSGKVIANHISLLSWLGIMGETMWLHLSNIDLKQTAESLAILCEHFLKAVPGFIEDVSPE